LVNRERLVNEFLRLVQINGATRNERAVADYLQAQLGALGLQVVEDDAGEKVGSNCGNLIAKLSGTRSDVLPVLFSAHMDTIEPTAGIRPVIADGIIRTDGSTILGADDRAGIAIILEALRVLKEERIAHGDLEIVFTVAEEGGLHGVKQLDYTQLQARAGFVLDAGPGPIGVGCNRGPAQDRIEAFIQGRTAHAGFEPEKGINAIQVAGIALAKMQLGRIDAVTTANIGRIEGGRATNIVPDMVHLLGEARSHDEIKLQQQTNAMRQAIMEAVAAAGATAKVEVRRLYNAYHIDNQAAVVKLFLRAAQQVGLQPQLVATGGGCDGNIFNAQGIPTLNLSIGMNDAHTVNEWIRIKDLVQAAELVVALMQNA